MEHWYDNEISRGILEAKYYHEGETTPQQFIPIMKLPVFFPMAAVSVSIFPISVLQEAVYIMWHVLPPVPFLS